VHSKLVGGVDKNCVMKVQENWVEPFFNQKQNPYY
jgi:hypothetical protein